MAHFSKLGINGKVIAVTPVDNNVILNAEGIEDEEVGRQYLENVHGWPLWKKTSYNTLEGKYYIFNESGQRVLGPDQSKAFRKNYGAIGYTYSEEYDGFIQPRPPHASWTLNTTTGVWLPPVTIEVPSVYTNESNVQKDIITQWDEANLRWTGKKNKTNESIDFIYNPSTKTWTSV
jgi:hypothetical protein